MTILIAGGVGNPDAEALELDATLNVKIDLMNKITSHPVEDRSSIADHAFNQNAKIDVEAVVTNTPVTSVVRQDKNLLTPSPSELDESRIQRAYDIIRAWYKNRTPIQIVTDVEIFDNCVISNLSVPRSVEWANAVKFEMSFEQIRISSTRTSLLLISAPQRDESETEVRSQGQQRQINTTSFGLIGGGGAVIDTLSVGGN